MVSRWEKVVPSTGLAEDGWLRYPSQLISKTLFFSFPHLIS